MSNPGKNISQVRGYKFNLPLACPKFKQGYPKFLNGRPGRRVPAQAAQHIGGKDVLLRHVQALAHSEHRRLCLSNE